MAHRIRQGAPEAKHTGQAKYLLVAALVVVAGVFAWNAIRDEAPPPPSSLARAEVRQVDSSDIAIAPDAAPGAVMPDAEPAPAGPPPPQMGEAFLDRFEKRELGDAWKISDGWSNGDWMANEWRASQVDVTPGQLRITLGAAETGAAKPLIGGEIRTRAEYRYGYFEVRMKAPRDPGLVTGVFSYARGKGDVRPEEIDIEIAGRDTRTLEVTYHQGGVPRSKKVALSFDAAQGFHTYALEWKPDEIVWYVDGVRVHSENGAGVRRLVRPQQFLVSLWAGSTLGAWTGDVDVSRAPWMLDVSCVGYAPHRPERGLCAD